MSSSKRRRKSKAKAKPPRQPSKYERDLRKLADEYLAANPGREVSLQEISEWLIKTGQWEQQVPNAVRELMRHLRQALEKAKVLDDDGNPVRWYHAIPMGPKQPYLWTTMDEISPENMSASLQSRSNSHYKGVKQIVRDQNYFNKKHNPGDPIGLSFNYDARLENEQHSGQYVDKPPPEVEDEPEVK